MKKRIPIGISDYQELKTENYYTVDKSLLIQEFLDSGAKVTMITRPRRFGKTLNMSMLAEFFDISKDSKDIFKDTAIMETTYSNKMNQYPTISLSFANCKGTENYLRMNIFYLLRKKMAEYLPLLTNEKLNDDFIKQYQLVYHALVSETDLARIQFSINLMCELLYKVYGKRVMLFIDEYDTPFIEAHINNCYDAFHNVLAGMLSNVLKDNPYLQHAMLTGIQRVAKENIFSGLNNLEVHTVKDKAYAYHFGFLKDEVEAMSEYYDVAYNDEVKAMYDGYYIGGIDIYNPWSIINYVKRDELIPFWVNVSSNMMIRNAKQSADQDFIQQYETLIRTKKMETIIDLETSFYEYSSNASLWGLFVNAGYLTIKSIRGDLYTLEIPNNEIAEEFKKLTFAYLKKDLDSFTVMMYGIYNKEPEMFIENYRRFLLKSTSYHDLISENSYHTLLLGLCASLYSDYDVKSNQEAGKGRYDILLQCKTRKYPSYILELKYVKHDEFEKHPDILKDKCKEALKQIETNKYSTAIQGPLIYIALAHSGKEVEMEWITQ